MLERRPPLVLLPAETGQSQTQGSCTNVCTPRKVDVRLSDERNSTPPGARPVHLIITTMKYIRTSRLSIKNSLSVCTRPSCTSRVRI